MLSEIGILTQLLASRPIERSMDRHLVGVVGKDEEIFFWLAIPPTSAVHTSHHERLGQWQLDRISSALTEI